MNKLIFLLIIASSGAHASDFICKRGSADPTIILKDMGDSYQFQFIKNGSPELDFYIPRSALNLFHMNKTIGPMLSYVPGWGETDGSLYGRLSRENAVFDIYVSGMAGEVVETLTGYSCD